MNTGKWALVTGASGGMGVEFASLLAERGYNLVLTARSADRLEKVASNLRSFGGQIHVERSDLSQEGAAAALVETIRKRGIVLDVLINNAGQGLHGDFVDQSAEDIEQMLRLNISSLTTLTHEIATGMAERRRGHILLVASLTAFMPCPTYAAYAASKAYVRNFGEALHAEMAPRDVTVTVLSPGLMDTGFLNAAGQEPSKSMKRTMTSPRETAKAGIDALFAGRQTVVAGSMNRLVAAVSAFIPRGRLTRMAGQLLQE
ncbi:SDR family NAD(P)-dependent oxidoreductase [Aurantiacibacter sp. DGU5]|uniref:SDR family NAD(P)-dependent oxidoreductase n=2 Tax=Aurantiacibacter flavus TaxID=3145232 RepID=A0ABV0CZT6_9SPHN